MGMETLVANYFVYRLGEDGWIAQKRACNLGATDCVELVGFTRPAEPEYILYEDYSVFAYWANKHALNDYTNAIQNVFDDYKLEFIVKDLSFHPQDAQMEYILCVTADVGEGIALWTEDEPSALYQRSYDAGSPTGSNVTSTGGMSNIRTGPGLNYEVIAAMNKNDTAQYLSEASVDERGVCWYHVRFGSLDGWVSSKYTTLY